MNEWITDLLALQDLDLKIRNLNLRIDTIPSEKKRLDSLVKDAVSDVEVAKDGLRRIERSIKEHEGEIAKLGEASRKLLTQSAMVKKNNEYQAMMADIEAKKNAVSDIETKILELLDQAESARQGVTAAEKELAVTQKSVKAEMADLVELKQELEEDIGEKLKLRKACESRIDTQTLEVYHRLLAGGKGEPVAMINQGVCGYCRLKVPPQTINNARKGVLTLCDNCSHILYLHS